MCKIIDPKNLNAYYVNCKANRAMKKFADANPELLDTEMLTKLMPRLVQLVLRVDTFKHPAGAPFFAYIKNDSQLSIVVDVQTGKAQVLDSSVIASETNVGSSFQLGGITYELANENARWKRYNTTKIESKKHPKPRKRLTPLSPEVANADAWTDK